MSELHNQIQARKARLQRFAEAATQFQKKSVLPLACAPLYVAPPAPKRRDYETEHSFPIYAPITWRILRAVSDEFGMPITEIVSRKQEPKYTLPRYVVIGLMLRLTNMSLPGIGRRIGGRDHTTVLNGKRRIEALLEGEAFRNRFEQIKAGVEA